MIDSRITKPTQQYMFIKYGMQAQPSIFQHTFRQWASFLEKLNNIFKDAQGRRGALVGCLGLGLKIGHQLHRG